MTDSLEIMMTIFSSIFVLFLPGFVWSFVLFPRKNEIDWIERIVLSFGLSIAIVPIMIFYINRMTGVKINILNNTIIIVIFVVIGIGTYILKEKKFLDAMTKLYGENKKEKNE